MDELTTCELAVVCGGTYVSSYYQVQNVLSPEAKAKLAEQQRRSSEHLRRFLPSWLGGTRS